MLAMATYQLCFPHVYKVYKVPVRVEKHNLSKPSDAGRHHLDGESQMTDNFTKTVIEIQVSATDLRITQRLALA